MDTSTKEVFDALGIRFELDQSPSRPLVYLAFRAMYGHGVLSELWAWHVRPWLFPKRQAEIEEAYAIALKLHEQEFKREVMKQKRLGR